MTDSKTDRPQDETPADAGKMSTAQGDDTGGTDRNDWADALAEQAGAKEVSDAAITTTQADGLGEWASAIAELQDAAIQSAQPTPAAADAKPAPLFQPLTGSDGTQCADIDLIMNVPVQLTVELGRTRMTIKNLLQLGQGSVVELDGLAGEPMDIYVNSYLIAQGEVVVVEDRYGIRITDIVTPSERINRLNNRR